MANYGSRKEINGTPTHPKRLKGESYLIEE